MEFHKFSSLENTYRQNLIDKVQYEGKVFKIPEYTKEQLFEMEWNEFKDAVRSVAGTGRDQTLLLTRYLQNTGQLV